MAQPVMLDDYRPRIVIECDTGEAYTFTASYLEAIAAGRISAHALPDAALQSIIAQWLCFVDIIAAHAGEDS